MTKTPAQEKWEQIQLEAATAWHNLDIAVEMVEANKKELSLSEYAEVQKKIEEQQQYIQEFLLQGKMEYDASKEGGTDNDVQPEGTTESQDSVDPS